MRNPFREHRRAQRDRRDMLAAEFRSEATVPTVRCTQCNEQPLMEYLEHLTNVNLEAGVMNVQWECPNCERQAFGDVNKEGRGIIDNANRVE